MVGAGKGALGPGARRVLRFETLDEMLADARACAGAAGVRRVGNWTLGQAMNHLAAWIDYPFVGYPPELVFSEEVKARAAKAQIMSAPMRPGERIVEGPAGTLATEVATDEDGLARLEAAAARLGAGAPVQTLPLEDPAFGVLTHHEWAEMSLRHAELHLSFFVRG
jgi:hypothetical protein